MKTKRTRQKITQSLSGRGKIPFRHQITLFAATLAGMIASIVLLILFWWKPTKKTSEPRDVQTETVSSIEAKPSVEDDDPKIFNLHTFGYFAVFLVGLIGFVLVAGALLAGSLSPDKSIVITPAPTLLPPAPRLETYPGENFPALHATQEAELNSYGWVDRQKGVVHIPIEQAMKLIAQSNLPVVTGTPVAITPLAP